MMRWLAFSLGIFLTASLIAEEAELPKDPGESFDIEPPLLIQELPPEKPFKTSPDVAPPNELDPERISAALEKAKKSAAAGERLYRGGIISKVESENRVLKVVRLEADLAAAHLELAHQTAAAQQSRLAAGEISQSEVEAANAALVAATKESETAGAERDKAELDAALLNLKRQQKLLALGSGRKSEVSRAADKVNALQQKN
jgi:hypothetical protein